MTKAIFPDYTKPSPRYPVDPEKERYETWALNILNKTLAGRILAHALVLEYAGHNRKVRFNAIPGLELESRPTGVRKDVPNYRVHGDRQYGDVVAHQTFDVTYKGIPVASGNMWWLCMPRLRHGVEPTGLLALLYQNGRSNMRFPEDLKLLIPDSVAARVLEEITASMPVACMEVARLDAEDAAKAAAAHAASMEKIRQAHEAARIQREQEAADSEDRGRAILRALGDLPPIPEPPADPPPVPGLWARIVRALTNPLTKGSR